MTCFGRNWFHFGVPAALVMLILLSAVPRLLAQGRTVSVDGEVRDNKTHAVVTGATITFQLPGGNSRRARTNRAGTYTFYNLAPGLYSVRVEARSFQPYEIQSVRVGGSRSMHLNFTLTLAPVKQQIVVSSDDPPLSIEPENAASTVRLQGTGLTGLPDDPNDFAAAVQALAGPSALGSTDPQLFVNGFIYDQMPPKQTIREIRINENPFSAENDRPATNRIEVATKSGGRQFHGEGYLNLDVGRWDTRNPFTSPLPPNPSRLYGSNVGGPITSRSSFFVSFERTEMGFRNAVSATVLNASLVPTPITESVPDFETRSKFSSQLDFTLNKANMLTVRYSSPNYSLPREGVGKAVLPESGYQISKGQQTAQVSETAVLSPQAVNEAKFQFVRVNLASKAYTLTPTIKVDDAFTTGSPSSILQSLLQSQWEFQNNISNVSGRHTIRAGIRLRGGTSHENLVSNSAGTWSFSSGSGPQLGPDNTPVLDANGGITVIPLSALERYRRTILFARQGLSPASIRLLGGGASSFSMDSGDPYAHVRLYDLGAYFQDNWHLRPNLLLGAGVRYEAQTKLQGHLNLGPRVSLAWSPAMAPKENPHTVVRGGVGLFYERLNDTLALQTDHSQHPRWHYSTSDPSVLDLFPVAPPLSSLAPFATPADTLRMSPNLQAPATLQATLSLEQELPFKTRLGVSLTGARTFRDWVLVDVTPFQKGHPRFLDVESSGSLTQRQLKVDLSNRLSKRVALTTSYVFNKADSNTDGVKTPAARPGALMEELGRSVKDIRHNFTLTGSVNAPWGLRLSPFIVASSGRPFNIITGIYQDEDIPVTERPGFAIDPTQPGVILTRFGAFTLNPALGDTFIPRNYGEGPPFFSASFRLSKTFAFGEPSSSDQVASDASSGSAEHRYSLIVSMQVINLTNHLNPGTPEGKLSSPQFGQANSLAPGFNFGGGESVIQKQWQANRRIEVQIRFTF